MFNPNTLQKDKEEKSKKLKAIKCLKDWSLSIIPVELQEGLDVDIREVICGDPSCAPVDTIFTLVWTSGGKGIFAVPSTAAEVSQDELIDTFPDPETLAKWKAGIKAPWPPRPSLRFDIGSRVECRIGPHPVKGWAAGKVVKLYYSEPSWPPNMLAPYQILLHDGRLIFAPQDTDQVIRLRPPAAPDAPSSPEINYADYDEAEEDEYEDMEEGDDPEEAVEKVGGSGESSDA